MDSNIAHMKSLRELFTVSRIARVRRRKSYLKSEHVEYNKTGNCIPHPHLPIPRFSSSIFKISQHNSHTKSSLCLSPSYLHNDPNVLYILTYTERIRRRGVGRLVWEEWKNDVFLKRWKSIEKCIAWIWFISNCIYWYIVSRQGGYMWHCSQAILIGSFVLCCTLLRPCYTNLETG